MKKKTMLTCAAITILSMAPFLTSCAGAGTADEVTEPEPIVQEVVVDNGSTNAAGSTEQAGAVVNGDELAYAQVVSVNGDVVTVVQGTVTPGTDGATFESDGTEQTFNTGSVTYVDAEGNALALNEAGEVGFAPGEIILLAEVGDSWAVSPASVAQADLAYNAGM